MNMLEKLDAMEHNDMHSCDLTGCTCGLDEVRAAVRELVTAADRAFGWCEHDSNSEWKARLDRLGAALAQFTSAQDDAG